MKITVDNSELKQVLACVTRVINTHVSIPILQNILITKEDDSYYMVANSSESELSLKINFNLISGKFEPICINPQVLLQMSAKLGSEQLTFTTNSNKVKIDYLTGSFSLPLFNAEEFPRLAKKLNDDFTAFSIESSYMLPTLTSAATMTNNKNVLRPILSTVAIDVVNDGVTIVATNGNRLYRRRHIPGAPFIEAGKPRLMLYPSIINSIIKDAFATSEMIKFEGDASTLHLSSDKANFISQNVEGNFPNYNSVIPKSFASQATISRRNLIEALERVILLACKESQMIRLTFAEKQITLSSSDIDFSIDGSESLELVESTVEDDFHISFKGGSLINLLRIAQTDEVIIKFNSLSQAAVVVENDPKSEILMLLMPCRDE